MLKDKELGIPDSYWALDYQDYLVTDPDGPGDIDALTAGEQRVPRYSWGDDDSIHWCETPKDEENQVTDHRDAATE